MSEPVRIPDAYRMSGLAMVALDAIARGERADRRVLKWLVRNGLAYAEHDTVCLSMAGWADAVVNGGKRIENRLKWSTSNFRGPLLIHAAQGMTREEWTDVHYFAQDEARITWRPPLVDALKRGGIVGRCVVVGVVRDGRATIDTIADEPITVRGLTDDEACWYMGAFALVLANVEPLPFVPLKGALGFFNVDDAWLAEQMRSRGTS